MGKSKFSIAYKDEAMAELVGKTDHKTLAVWTMNFVERVMPYFEEAYTEDHRPRNAIEVLQIWIQTGVFKMAIIRMASLASHTAAREVGEDNAECRNCYCKRTSMAIPTPARLGKQA